MRNWKTTIGGILMVLSGAVAIGLRALGQGEAPYEASVGLITGGLALIAARDAGTGSDAQ
jgi:hypothetical protein